MRAKLGWPAAALACLLLVTTPGVASADDDPAASTTETSVEETAATGDDTTTTAVTSTTAGDPTTTAGETTSTTTEIPTIVGAVPAIAPAETIAPASPGPGTPSRGTQLQVKTPPPPPPTTTTLAPWDPFLLPANSGTGRRAVYSKSKQTVWALDANNNVIKSHRVSGKQTPLDPRPGTYRVWSRSRYTFSINNPSITWGYMVRFAWGAQGGNIGFHEIPFQNGRPVQSIWQLGQPLSGGCVRQWVGDAIWMWNWAGLGTKVVVTP